MTARPSDTTPHHHTTMGIAPGRGIANRLTEVFLLIFVCAIPVSICIAQSALFLASLFLVVDRKGRLPSGEDWLRPLTIPALAYSAVTVLSALHSQEMAVSLKDTKEVVLFAIIPVLYLHFKGRDLERLALYAAIAGATSALWGVTQYVVSGMGLGNRASGPLGHYMTFGGVMMFLCIFMSGRLLFLRAPHGLFWLSTAFLCLLAVLASYSRNAWIGLAAGLAVLLACRRPVLLLILPVLAALVIMVSPAPLRHRFASILDPTDPSNLDRIHMAVVGMHIIRDHPFLGVGPARVGTVYPEYRRRFVPGALARHNPHLHNNVIQIAAERGLLGLAAWLAFVFGFFWSAWKGMKKASWPGRFYRINAMACMVALLAAGMFEYNFGDSEVKMMLLTFVTLAFVPGSRDGDAALGVSAEKGRGGDACCHRS